MKSISYDQVHTEKKQKHLKKMMLLSAAQTLTIENNSPLALSCAVCGSAEIGEYTEKFGYRLDKCNECGHIFCNPMPNDVQLNAYYNGPMKEFENNFFEDSFEQRIPIFDYRIGLINKFVQSGNLLDIGSAIGIFVEAHNRSNSTLNVSCCEPSKDACRRLSEKFPEIQLHNTWLQDLEESLKYDVITLWDTLEHIVDLESFLSKIHALLAPSGFWFFSTPNTKSYEWEIARKNHVQLLPPGHVNLFNTDNIQLLLEKHQFKMVQLETPNASLDLSYIEKISQGCNDYELQVGSFLKDNLHDIKFKKAFEAALIESKRAGNMLVVAQKK